ncbi:MAG: hypothetical protein VW491_07265, partial [Gammaproteobacteria bacterium]
PEHLTCHFGTCEGRRDAVEFVTHNFTAASCEDPRARAIGSFSGTDTRVYADTRAKCPTHRVLQSACRRRRVKSEIDTLLIAMVTAVVAIKVQPWFFLN